MISSVVLLSLLSVANLSVVLGCRSNTDCSYTCYMGQDLCYMEHTFPGETGEGYCMGGTVVSRGTCEKKRSLGESCVDHDNNHIHHICSQRNYHSIERLHTNVHSCTHSPSVV